MKKKYIVMFSVLILSVVIYICIPKTKEEESNKTKPNVNTNGFLTLMLEQDDGTYQKSSASTWPTSGYIYNDILSKCENGGKLMWNDELKTITLKTDKSDKCYVYFDKYINPIVNNITVTDITTSSISISVSARGGTNSVATYYYSINNGSYSSSTSNTYTFTGLSKGTTYTIKVYVKDTNGVSSAIYTTSAETESAVLLADYIKGLYTSQGSNGIYYHTSSLANSAADNSYRYAGANPNNYVCFGSDASTCSSDNLYRIIGVFGNEVKLIKSVFANSDILGTNGCFSNNNLYCWSTENAYWDLSELNIINLNTNYLNKFDSKWINLICDFPWNTKNSNIEGVIINGTAKELFNYEINNAQYYMAKIGLIYLSDYGFSADNSLWNIDMYNVVYNSSNNWLYSEQEEWTIIGYGLSTNMNGNLIKNSKKYKVEFLAPQPSTKPQVGSIFIGSWKTDIDSYLNVRPSFYLTSSTTYISGSGTSSDPIRIN